MWNNFSGNGYRETLFNRHDESCHTLEYWNGGKVETPMQNSYKNQSIVAIWIVAATFGCIGQSVIVQVDQSKAEQIEKAGYGKKTSG